MKNYLRFLCLVLACSLLLAVPTQATETVEPRASAFFAAHGTDLSKISDTKFQIWFDVTANAGTSMQELGVSEISVYRSADQQSWSKMRTYTTDDYPEMVEQNTQSHGGYITYNFATPGYYYTARITFYAKNSVGIAELDEYTEILGM